jgi:Tfp pilus assembly protein PilO
MTKKWFIGTVLVVVFVLVAGFALLILPARQRVAALRATSIENQATAAQLANKISLLKKQSSELLAQEAKLSAVRQHLPENVNLPSIVRSLTGLAKASSVELLSISPTAAQAVAQTAPAPASTDSAAMAASGAKAPATNTVANPSVVLSAVPVQLTVKGDYSELRVFLNGLEALQRSFLVTSTTISRDQDSKLSMALSGDVFTLAGLEGRTAGAGANSSSGQSPN